MSNNLPNNLTSLLELKGIHDGIIVQVIFECDHQLIKLTLRCGDNVVRYFDLVVTYNDAEISPANKALLKHIAAITHSDRYPEVCNHKIESIDGYIIHEIEFFVNNSYRSCTIKCRSLDWYNINQPNRDIVERSDRFIER